MEYRKARRFIALNFTNGVYSGDNPYLTEVTIESMLNRWMESGTITPDILQRLTMEFCNLN